MTKSVIVPEIYQEQSKRLVEIGKNAIFIKKLKIPVIDQNILKQFDRINSVSQSPLETLVEDGEIEKNDL